MRCDDDGYEEDDATVVGAALCPCVERRAHRRARPISRIVRSVWLHLERQARRRGTARTANGSCLYVSPPIELCWLCAGVRAQLSGDDDEVPKHLCVVFVFDFVTVAFVASTSQTVVRLCLCEFAGVSVSVSREVNVDANVRLRRLSRSVAPFSCLLCAHSFSVFFGAAQR